jgi:hypothetical protein
LIVFCPLLSRATFGQIFKESFFGADAIRFGSFFGVFSFLWKFVNNGLKLYRGKDDRLNGAVAGNFIIFATFSITSPSQGPPSQLATVGGSIFQLN